MDLNADQVARITAYLDATTPLPAYADLMFVFGARQLAAAELAAELFHRKLAPLIVVTGGRNPATGLVEADQFFAYLTQAGIPAENIIVENRSTNTLENVVFSIPLIEQKLALASLKTVLAVCKWNHSRRALMTLKRHFPSGIRYYASTYVPDGITRENWPGHPRAAGGMC